MTLGEARAAWLAHDDVAIVLNDEDILALVKSSGARLERQVRWRDWRERIASIAAAALIAPIAMSAGWMTRAGVVVVLGGLLLIPVRLARASRAHRSARSDSPVYAVLRAERSRVEAQIHLLETVLWWYVLPIDVGSMMIVAGKCGVSWFTAAFALAAGLLSWGVVWLNGRAARTTLIPARDELTELIAQFESSNGSAERMTLTQEFQ